MIPCQGTGCGNGLDPSPAEWPHGSVGLSPTQPHRLFSTSAGGGKAAPSPATKLSARPRREAGHLPSPKAHSPSSGRSYQAQVKPPPCEICCSAPSSYRWAVKGGWLRKVRNRANFSSEEMQQTSSLQLAASWRQGTTHHLCSGCKIWAFEIASTGESQPRSTQGNDTTKGPWAQLIDILELAPHHTMLPKSPQLLDWIETHEKAFEEGSLEHWVAYRIATCLEEELEDAEGVCTVAAQLQIPRKQTDRGDFCFLVANITTHRREIHTWICQQGVDAFALQETHLLPQPMKEAQINYDRGKWCTAGIPAHDTGKGTSGGLLLGAKTHINMREGPRFSIQGKGFLFGIFRFPGYDRNSLS